MKIIKILSLFALGLVLFTTSSCNKEPAPLVITGSWSVDTTRTNLVIKFDEHKAQENPVALGFLREKIETIRKNLTHPNQIIFEAPNKVLFKMDGGFEVIGTYTLLDTPYFRIDNPLFPDGIIGGSDNKIMELYHNKGHILEAIMKISTPYDPPIGVFDELIIEEQSAGITVYRR